MEILNLDKCSTNEEVCNLVRARVGLISFDELMVEVDKSFVDQKKAARAIYTGLAMNMNVFLSGPGGYGKSSLVKFILNEYRIPNFTIVGYKDMPVDALLGIPNMKKLIQDSEYEIDFSKCIFGKKGVVIGEEFTDILPSTAAALKDVLTEKGFRHGDLKAESFISTMIICANKSSNEIADDDSKKALYDERFPLKVEVNWESHTVNMYMKLLSLKYPTSDMRALYFMSKLFETNHLSHNNIITPRKAIDITNVFLSKGLAFINSFEINTDSITQIKRQSDIEFNKESKESVLLSILSHINKIPKTKDLYTSSLLYALHKIKSITVDEECIDSIKAVEGKLLTMFENIPSLKSDKFSVLKSKFKEIDGNTSS
jgi:hypothetical protein